MEFVCSWQIQSDDFEEVMRVFTASDPTKEFPDSVKLIGRWHCAASRSGVAIIESSDVADVMRWAMKWNGMMEFEVEPCVRDEVAGQLSLEKLAATDN